MNTLLSVVVSSVYTSVHEYIAECCYIVSWFNSGVTVTDQCPSLWFTSDHFCIWSVPVWFNEKLTSRRSTYVNDRAFILLNDYCQCL